jgi:CDP-paratose 2-epimerase
LRPQNWLSTDDLANIMALTEVAWRYDEKNREGDHICYISDMGKFCAHYPRWSLTRRVPDIIDEMVRVEALVS